MTISKHFETAEESTLVESAVPRASLSTVYMSRKRSRLTQSYKEEADDEPSITKRRKLGSVGDYHFFLTEPLLNIEKPKEKLWLARRFIGFLTCCIPFGGLFGVFLGGLFGGVLVAINSFAECTEAWQEVCNIEKWSAIHDVIEKIGKAVKSSAAIVNAIFPHPYTLLLAAAALVLESFARITQSVPENEKGTTLTAQLGQCGQMLTDLADLTLVSDTISRKTSLIKRISKIGKVLTKMEAALEKSFKIKTDQHAEKTAADVLSVFQKGLEAVANFLHVFRIL